MADCSYHPGKEAVGACVNCGKMVCLACRTELQDRVYCQPCANKLFVAKSEIQVAAPAAPAAPVVESVSGAWWLLPIFFTWLGGIIAWAATKARDPKKARSMLTWGIIITVIEFILLGIVIALVVAGILVFGSE
jgi:hypothetical protein